MSVNLTLKEDSVTPDLARLASQVPDLKKVMGVAMRNALISHFRVKNATPNRLGGTRTNFWLAVANSCSAPVVNGSGVMVRINHPHAAIHVYGGRITPKKAKMLAIPVTAEAHGKSPRVFSDLRPVWREGRPVGLALGEKMYYVFKKRVWVPRDPRALPPDDKVRKAVTTAARIFLRRRENGS
ncbi:MAG: hypothetical protein KHX31_06720 [Akkermansia sp.]|uniref:hypothetical protein n=1 Tax=Akkermansia sp. TaxID=1872421 RepID=UPI0025C37FBB|nr:hypothetical protein [Akkermansia sp.]MBS5508311.1 hypothetical protein [Akkermansia sp.]